ncbi:polyketide synthase [Paractinoplanes tereljensis]|uniref:Polyketide synthase n=2 Tax=Paractinoplanes tereljensis TaxID=571912 RepID=A0A919NR61_9ACTN|nr:polyketide synthase [Actinoplanes tereljensis]
MEPIAVVGLAALMPGARDTSEFWANIVAGRDLITEVPAGRWPADGFYDPDPATPDTTYSNRGAFLPDIEFDALAHGLPPATLGAIDPAQLLGLTVADALLADLGRNLAGPPDRERVSVILGSSTLSRVGTMDARIQRPVWLAALRDLGVGDEDARRICDRIADRYAPWQEDSFPGLLSNVVAGRIANRLDLHGTNCTVDAACASSLAALSAGVNELALGQADLVITGGVDVTNNPLMYVCFSKTPALSPTGDARPFAADADGTMLGEGLAMVGLRRLADAERDGDRVYAVIRGLGTSSDGRGGAIYAPMANGQVRALRRAYEAAGYGPDTVDLVEAHGTATRAGDAAEFESLRRVFGETGRPDRGWCALGSIKSQIGHTKAAAGAAGLVKTVLALHQRTLPPTIKVREPNPALGIEGSPFYLNTVARPWTRRASHARRAAVSSFGFGGANFHLTLEEYGGANSPARIGAGELVLRSAGSPADLIGSDHFDAGDPHRLAVVDGGDLPEKLDRAAEMMARQPGVPFTLPGGVSYSCGPADPGRVAFLFPGQGSQYVGMGGSIAQALPTAQDVWDFVAGPDLADVVFPPPVFGDEQHAAQERRLTDTRWAQPALAAHSLSLLALLDSIGLAPDCVAGHSLGELVALHAAGVLDATSLLRLARHRGSLLADASVSPGAMLAVDAEAAVVEAALKGDVWIANRNAPRQTVVSGTATAIDALEERLSADGVTARRLAVSAAFHSPMMRSAEVPMHDFLATLSLAAPRIDVYANEDAAIYDPSPAAIRRALARHPGVPVRFQDQIEAMYAAGARTFVEVGPGAVLTGLVGRILGDRPHLAVSLDRRGRDGVAAFHEGVGRLAVHGVAMTLPPTEKPAPTERPRMPVRVNGTGYVAPPAPAPAPSLPATAQTLPTPAQPALPTFARTLPASAQTLPAQTPAASTPPTHLEPVAPMTKPEHNADWLAAMQEMQRQTAEAHMHFQRTLAESHQAFLQMAENTFAAFAGQTPRKDQLPRPAQPPLTPTVSAFAPLAPAPAAPAPLTPAPLAAAPIQPSPLAPTPPPAAPNQPAPSAAAPTQAVPIAAVPIAASELHQPVAAPVAPAARVTEPVSLTLLLAVVADKTGYPADMLNGGMDLEADLGIDSIKKVEIFAAVRERAEGLPDTDSAQMAQLFQARTLDEVMRGITAEPNLPGLPRLQVQPVAAPACGLTLAGLRDGPITVVDGGSALAPAVVEQLRAHGITATAADLPASDAHGAIQPDGDAHGVPLLGGDVHGVILLGGMAPAADARRGFQAARVVAAAMTERGGVFVTVQDTGGCFGLAEPKPAAKETETDLGGPQRAWLGGFAALTRTAAQEWPAAAAKAIDCERGGRGPDEVAAAIVTELLTGGPTLDVGLRADGTRWTLTEIEAPPDPSDPRITDRSVLVVSGGARGVTAAALLALAAEGKPRMLLLGRTELADEPEFLAAAHDEPSLTRLLANHEPAATPAQLTARARVVLAVREVRATLAGLERAGATVRYAAVDVTDRAALDRELARVRREWGAVTGLVHGAGVLADKRIADKTDDQFDRVYATKVAGLHALLDATADDPLDVLCLFSSVAARFGNPGQCDYAMANEVLNQVALAEQRRRPACRVRAIGWGPWEAGMVTPAHAAHFRDLKIPLIPLDAGARAFVAELSTPGDVVQVLITGGETAEAGRPRLRAEARTDDFLTDHAPAGVPVLPLAMAVEWFAAAGQARYPGRPTALGGLRVLHRIELPDLANGGHRFTIEVTPADELRLGNHYRARLAAPERPRTWSTPTALEPFNGSVYDSDVLFHGPRFQMLREVRGLSREGAEAQVVGVRAVGWPDAPWWSDPAAVDGALQTAVLWARHTTGHATLPMGVEAIHVHRPGPAPATLRCLVRATSVATDETRCDIALFDGDGEIRTELLGVSLIRRPDVAPAGRR